MSQTNVPVTAGSGKNIDAFTTTTQGNYRQTVVIGDPSVDANVAPVDATNGLKVDVAPSNGIGSLTETAPATDTASSGLNGRLQRIAQRLTSLIALLPSALGAGGGLKVDGSGTALPVSGTVSITANSSVNVAQLAGTTTDTNSGVKSAGTLRVVLATDQPQLTNKLLVTPDANSAVNVAQMNGVAVTMGNGVSGTGVQRVVIASDNSAVSGLGAGATGSAVPSNSIYEAGIAKTALPSAASDGNLTGVMLDKFGRQVVLPNTIRDLVGTQTTTISASTSETTIITAGGSGVFLDLLSIFISNTSATAARVDIRDATAGSVIFQLYIPAGDVRGISFSTPWPQTTANNNWTAQSSASVTDLRISAHFAKNK